MSHPGMVSTRQARPSSIAWLLVALCLAAGHPAAQGSGEGSFFGEHASFRLSRAALRDRGASPALLQRVRDDAFAYFRLLSEAYAARTCHEFRDLRWHLPYVAVHGDAHVEQFAVTPRTYGLVDFDRGGFGPALVDLVRYASSLHFVCRQAAWPCDAERAVGAYFDAYRDALDHAVTRTPPAIASRLRQAAPTDREAWLAALDRLVKPMPPADEQRVRVGWERFLELMRATPPERPERFYRIVRMGTSDIGIGSSLEHRILIRIAGATDAPADDVMVEARVVGAAACTDCVSRPASGGALHSFLLTTVLGGELPEVFGFLPAGEAPSREFWVQSWDAQYREVTIADIASQADLDALARDAATQLAGHFWVAFPERLRSHQRFAQLRAFDMTAPRARTLARRLAEETVREWERFGRRR